MAGVKDCGALEVPDYRNKALEAAWRKGRDARLDGMKKAYCPYKDHRTDRGSVTFSRAFRHAWKRGWEAADEVAKW